MQTYFLKDLGPIYLKISTYNSHLNSHFSKKNSHFYLIESGNKWELKWEF